jgi:hypothetical protein
MNATAPTAPKPISLGRAMFCFALAIVAVMYALAIASMFPPGHPELFSADRLPRVGAALAGAAIPILFTALPSAVLFGALLWLIERRSSKPRGVAAWLIAGVMAAAPIAGFYWYLDTVFEPLEFDPQPPHALVNILPPLTILGFGLIGALAAWWWRRKSVAR